MTWYTYMVECRDRSLYTGVTTDLPRRVCEHNSSPKGSKYCRSRRPVRLVYAVESASRSEAQKLEYRLKQLSRRQKLALVCEGGILRWRRHRAPAHHSSVPI